MPPFGPQQGFIDDRGYLVKGGFSTSARWAAIFTILLLGSSAAPVLADSAPEQPPPVTLPDVAESAETPPLPTSADMAETLAGFRVKEEQRLEELESPAAVQEREESATVYENLTATEAKQLLTSQFAEQLEALDAEPARFLSDATLGRPLGEDAATVVDGEGRKQILDGTIPVRAENEEGELSKVDLTLQRGEDGWEAANPLVEVNIGESAEESVEVGEEGISISLVGAEESVGKPLGDKNLFFGEVEDGSDSDLLVSPVAGGVELFDQLRSEASPETLRFQVEMPAGAELLPMEGGGAKVVASDGSELVEIPAPTAVDAQGTEVPVQLEVEGKAVVLHVEHRGADFAYPLLVDPGVFQDYYWHNWYNAENLQALSNGAWHWNSNVSWVYGSTSCIYKCWASGRGLYISTPNGSLPANGWGQWSYSAPNSETYLANAWISPFYRENHTNCPQSLYGQPYDYDGMWNETSWNRVLYNQANEIGHSDIESWGRAFIIGMGTSSGISIPCWRDIIAGGVAIWLEDWSRPTLTTAPPPKQWTDKVPIRLGVSAYDAGLGVQRFEAKATNASGGTETWVTNSGCTGIYEAPCPHTWNLGESPQPLLYYNPTNLPEGIDKVSVTAYDAAEKPSFTTNEMEIEVDHSAPTITLSGTLTEQGKFGTEKANYTIRAEATDGVAESSNPADARSGVKKITFEENGKNVTPPYEPGCPTQSCAWLKELEVPAHEMTPGQHTLVVKATDALGHVATKELTYTTGDKRAPTLTASGFPSESTAAAYGSYSSAFGSAGAGGGQFSHPAGIAADGKGSLFVVDESHSRIEKFSEAGAYLSSFGSQGSGNGQFARPTDVAVAASGNVWVADAGNNRLEEFNEKGEFLASIGSFGTGNLQFNEPESVAIGAKGTIYVGDTYNHRVQELNEKGEFIRAFGTNGSGQGQIAESSGIAVGTGETVWVADWENQRVEEFSETGTFIRQFGTEGSGNGQFQHPDVIDIDKKGDVWVGDEGNNRVEEFNQNGEYVTQFGSKGTGAGQFSFGWPMGIATNSKGSLWIADTGNNRVQRWLTPLANVDRNLDSVSATAQDSEYGATSIALKLTRAGQSPEVVQQTTQACPGGACSLSANFEGLELSEQPAGAYLLTVTATDGAGNATDVSRVISVDPSPPSISLSGTLAERSNEPLNAPSGELSIKAGDANLVTSGVSAINVERDHQRVAAYPTSCSGGCQEASASFRYSALRDGAERAIRAAAEPMGSTTTSLGGVSCLTANNCRAVGYYKNSVGVIVTLIEHWDGTAWQVESSPNPAGVLESKLEAISCISSSNCTAVGFYKTGSEAFSTLAERWNGSAWTIVSTPNPSGASKSYLYGVSCATATDCWAVGKSTSTALLERWNGSEWMIASLAEPPAQLKRIACASSIWCVAVTGQEGRVLRRWNGSAWSKETLPVPTGGTGGALKAISCAAEGACTAVGTFIASGAGFAAPLAVRWNGSQWSAQSAPDPFKLMEGTYTAGFEGVSCATATSCTAAGTYSTAASETLPLVESWDGSEWALQSAPAPGGTKTAVTEGISCAGSFECGIVGHYSNAGTKALAEIESHGSDSHRITVEAVDKFGNAESKSIEVDVPEEVGVTPACSKKVQSRAPEGILTASQAASGIEASLPRAVAASQATTNEANEKEINPSYSSPKPNLESEGNLAEGETSVIPAGGFTLAGVACITPGQTTSAATEAKVVNGDAAVFANTAPHTDTVIRPTSGGAAVVQSLRGPKAPSSLSWNVTVNPGEKMVELPSGMIVVTKPWPTGEGPTSVLELSEPEAVQSPQALNSAAVQLEIGEYQMSKAQSETTEEVVAIIPQPWVVLAEGGIVPAQMELKVTEIPTEYNVVFVPPPFESNMPPESEESEELMAEATISAVVNGNCLEESPCGTFDIDRAARYAEYFGNPNHDRNPHYIDYGANNCTNFLSQIVSRGGMSYMRAWEEGPWKDGYWWYNHKGEGLPVGLDEDTESWRFSDMLPRHLWQYGLAYIDSVNEPWGWSKGDMIAEDWYGTNGKGDFNHVQFVVGTEVPGSGPREPLIANESEPEKANYSHKLWARVKERIEEEQGHEWNRVPLAVKHTIANWKDKKHDPENLYTSNGVFYE